MTSLYRTGALALVLALGAAPAGGQAPVAVEAAPPQPAAPAAPAPTPEAFRDEIVRLYTFDRTGMAYEDFVALAAQFEALWDRARADKAGYLPLLRAELAREGNPPFFYFDGAELLRELSQERADMELALSRIERMDMDQVASGGYLHTVTWFANHGYDTTRAALQFVDRPAASFTVDAFPHITTVDPLKAMVFALFPMEEERFVGALIERVQTATGDGPIFRLLHCIWATATPQGRAALTAYAADATKPTAARNYAREMLSHRGDGGPPSQTEAELRAERRRILGNPFGHGRFERFHAITDDLVKVAG